MSSDLFDQITGDGNAEYFDYFPGLSVSDDTGILGEGLVLSGVAPVGVGDYVDPRIFSTSGIQDLANEGGFSTDITGANSSSTDLYSYAYYHPNGDVHFGSGYAASGTVASGQSYTGYTDENGYTGTYYIGDVFSGYDSTYINQVGVSSYYDAETNLYTYVDSYLGTSGLGSESGYAYYTDALDDTNYFGFGYEADLTV